MVDESRLEPLAFVQRLRNRRCVVVCQHCGAACGGSEHPLLHCVAKRCPLSRDALAQALKEHDVRGVSPKCVVYCRKGCGETYCGNACEAAARAAGHGSLCCGPLKEDDPMVQFRVQAMESGLFDEFVLAAKVLALAAERPKGAAAAWLKTAVAERAAPRGPRFEGVRPAALWKLLVAGAPALAKSGDAAVFSRLVGFVVEAAVPVERPSPLVAYCKGAVDAAEQQFLLDWLREDTDEQREAYAQQALIDGAAPDGGDSDGESDEALDFRDVAVDAEIYFEGFEGLAIIPAAMALDHACAPTHAAAAAPGAGPLRVALTPMDGDRKAFSKRTVARCETAVDVEERGEALFKRGLGDCGCARCLYDRHGDASVESLRDIAACAQADGRHEDALAAFCAILVLAPRDADALYGRARVTGWMDRWSAERRLMRAALDAAPDDARIRKHVGDADAYHAGACDVAGWAQRRVPFETLERPTSDDDDGEPPAFVYAFDEPVVPAASCADAIAIAEAHASHGGGWTTARHFAVPTTDVPVREVPALLEWFNDALRSSIFPALGALYGLDPARLRVIDAFLVKYSAAAQRSLPLHSDQSQISITLPLNSSADYDGGGTYFHDLRRAVNRDAGGLVAFPGFLPHAGHAITRGTRFVVVAFLYEYREADEEDDVVFGDDDDDDDLETGFEDLDVGAVGVELADDDEPRSFTFR